MMYFIANIAVVAIFLLGIPLIMIARLLSDTQRGLVFYYGLMVVLSVAFAAYSALSPKGVRLAFMRAVCSDTQTLAGALEMYSIDNPTHGISSFLHIDNISKIDGSTFEAVRKAGYLQSVPQGRRMEVIRSYRGWQVEADSILTALNSYNREHGLSQYSINSVKTIDRKSLIILKQQGYLKVVPSIYIIYMLNNYRPDNVEKIPPTIDVEPLYGIEPLSEIDASRSRMPTGDWWMR